MKFKMLSSYLAECVDDVMGELQMDGWMNEWTECSNNWMVGWLVALFG